MTTCWARRWCSSPTKVRCSGRPVLLLVSRPWLPLLLKVHKASFVLWFGVMTIHVLSHLAEVLRLAPRDFLRRTRREVTGAGTRQWLIAASWWSACYSDFSCSVTWATGSQRRRAQVNSAGRQLQPPEPSEGYR